MTTPTTPTNLYGMSRDTCTGCPATLQTMQTGGWSPQKQFRRLYAGKNHRRKPAKDHDGHGRKCFAFLFALLESTCGYLISIGRDNTAFNPSTATLRLFSQDRPHGARGFGPSGLSSLRREPKSVPGRLGTGVRTANGAKPSGNLPDGRTRADRRV